jgi:hypothetical protein
MEGCWLHNIYPNNTIPNYIMPIRNWRYNPEHKILKIAHLRGGYATQCMGTMHPKEGSINVLVQGILKGEV